MFWLSNTLHIAMIAPPAPESGMSTAGACADWELVLHAFFDGELDAVDSLACIFLGIELELAESPV